MANRTTKEAEAEVEVTSAEVTSAEVTSETTSNAEKYLPLPLDGGYGWVIVFASFLANALVEGLFGTFGQFLPYFMDTFNEGRGKTSLAGSLFVAIVLGSGAITGALINLLGCRKVTIAGALIATAAFLASTHVHSINVFIFLYGGLSGFGVGLLYLPAQVMVGYYFERKRAIAIGISSSGAGIGMLVMAPAVSLFLSSTDWKGAMMLVCCFVVQGVVIGALMRPLTAKSNSTKAPRLDARDLSEKEKLAPDLNHEDRIHNYDIINEKEVMSNDPVITSNPVLYSDSVDSNVRGISFEKSAISSHDMASPPSYEDTFYTPHTLKTSLSHLKYGNAGGICHSHTDIASKKDAPLATKRTKSLYILNDSNAESVGHYRRCTTREDRDKLKEELAKPMNRLDIFYSGSIYNLNEFQSQPSLASYIASVTVIPQQPSKPSRGCCQKTCPSIASTLKDMLHMKILLNPYFLVICLASVFIQVGYFVPIVFITDYAASIDIPPHQAAALVSTIGLSNAIGRAAAGAIANLPCVKALHVTTVCLVMAGIATILAPYACADFVTLAVYAGVFGYTIAAFVPLTPVFLVEYLGLTHLTNAFGLLSVVRGAASLAGAPIAGFLMDTTSSYHISFIFAGSCFIVAGCLHYLLPLIDHCRSTPSSCTARHHITSCPSTDSSSVDSSSS